MRDIEFSKTFERLIPRLDQFFRKRLKGSQFKDDKAIMVDDLIQLTALEALENSRRPQYESYTIEKLIFLKAANICSDLFNNRKHVVRDLEDAETVGVAVNTLENLDVRMRLGEIHRAMPKKSWQIFNLVAEGYHGREIAERVHTTETPLRMYISRQRAKIAAKLS